MGKSDFSWRIKLKLILYSLKIFFSIAELFDFEDLEKYRP